LTEPIVSVDNVHKSYLMGQEAVSAFLAAPGTLVGSGSPIVTLLDTTQSEFHTTKTWWST